MILVAGAAGNIGGELVRVLTEAGQLVRALTRDGRQPAAAPGAEAMAADLNDPASLRPALRDATGVFLLPGYASGPQALTPADRVTILGQVLGRDLEFQAQLDDEARAEMSATTPAQYVDAFFNFYADGALDESKVLPTVHTLTGRPPRTFEQWATAHAGAFR